MSQPGIVLDVMGGDDAPGAILDGAILSCSEEQKTPVAPERVLLVGDEATIRSGLEERNCDLPFAIQHASEVIGMEEKPGQALRSKSDSSISVGIGLVKSGMGGAFVSMGNTGAVVGASTLSLGTLPSVRRPGIAVTMHLTGKPVTVLDMGANAAPKAAHLEQYAVMGETLARDCYNIEDPRIALLNIGEESSKGTELLREANRLLEESAGNFIGNLESNQIFEGQADVIVTDGFTGNIVLKLCEGLSTYMLRTFMAELQERSVERAPELIERIRRDFDYAEYGGALLLGVQGVVVIGHGRSGGAAVANALGMAARALDVGVNEHIERGLRTPDRTPGSPRT